MLSKISTEIVVVLTRPVAFRLAFRSRSNEGDFHAHFMQNQAPVSLNFIILCSLGWKMVPFLKTPIRGLSRDTEQDRVYTLCHTAVAVLYSSSPNWGNTFRRLKMVRMVLVLSAHEN